ncbi:MAG: AmmeMemoRadiSam system protein A [Spirochaetales bacterium]
MDLTLTEEEQYILLQVARQAVTSVLEGWEYTPPPPTGNLLSRAGVFVTIHTRKGNLRGCIGQLVGRTNLVETVKETARSSAFHDPRFPPVRREELGNLVFEISVLSPFRPAKPEEVIPGTHGIYIKNGFYSGLLLPQVATEQGWDRLQFLDHGCRKAGLSPGCWQDPRTELYVFTAFVFKEESP